MNKDYRTVSGKYFKHLIRQTLQLTNILSTVSNYFFVIAWTTVCVLFVYI